VIEHPARNMSHHRHERLFSRSGLQMLRNEVMAEIMESKATKVGFNC
jgi:hypothetical protein